MQNNMKQRILYACKASVGIVFCVSAVLKLMSIDSFEIYIYQFQLFGMSFSYLVARALICMELILGIALIINICKREVYITALLLLSFFTFFLLYVYFFRGNEENCHCFGDIIEIKPLPSIFKNILFIALLLVSKNAFPFLLKHDKIIGISLSVAVLLTVFIISPPDNWLSSKSAELNEIALKEAFANGILDENDFFSDEKIICFYGLGCKFCELVDKKIGVIQKRHPDLEMNLIGIFWGSEEAHKNFIEESGANYSKTYLIDPIVFLKITNGTMPVVLVIKDGIITNKLKYRNIQENVFLERH